MSDDKPRSSEFFHVMDGHEPRASDGPRLTAAEMQAVDAMLEASRVMMREAIGRQPAATVPTSGQLGRHEEFLRGLADMGVIPCTSIKVREIPMTIRLTLEITPEGDVRDVTAHDVRTLTYVSFASRGSPRDQCLGVCILDGELDVGAAAARASRLGINPGGEVLAVSCCETDSNVPAHIFEAMWNNCGRLIPVEEARLLFEAKSIRELDEERRQEKKA